MVPGVPTDPEERLLTQADRIARHLVGSPATAAEQARYAAAVRRRAQPLDPASRRLWALMFRRPRLFKPVDAGLALVDPTGPIRQRLLTMLAILEASPARADLFLPRVDRRMRPWGFVAGVVGGIARAGLGLPVVLLTRRRWR